MCRRVIPIAHADLERAIDNVRAEAAATGHPGGCVALAKELGKQAARPETQAARYNGRDNDAAEERQRNEHNDSAAEAWPGSEMDVLLARDGHLVLEKMTWGFVAPWSVQEHGGGRSADSRPDGKARKPKLIYNTRIESALEQLDRMARGLEGGMWGESLATRRCVVPTFGFYEPHRTLRVTSPKTGRPIAQQVRFGLSGEDVTFMAGIYQDGRFSIVTTAPNGQMSPVHDRMPLVLTSREVSTWLGSRFASRADRSMTRFDVAPE